MSGAGVAGQQGDWNRTVLVPRRAELRIDVDIHSRDGFCRCSAHRGGIDNACGDGQ